MGPVMIELKLFHILTFFFCNIHSDIIVPHVSGPNGLCASISVLQFLYISYLPVSVTCLDHPSLILPYCQFLLNISSKALRLLFCCVGSVWIWISKKTKHLQMLTSRWCSSLLKVSQCPEGFFSETCLPLQRSCLCLVLAYIIHLILYSVFLHY